MLHGHLAGIVLLGDVRRAVEELYRHPGVAVFGGFLGYHPEGIIGVGTRIQSLLCTGGDYLQQLRCGVAVELHAVGTAEGGSGGLVEVHIDGALGDHHQRYRGPRIVAGTGELVDEVGGPLLEQDVNLVEYYRQTPLVGDEMLGEDPRHLVGGESALRESPVEMADQLHQRAGLVGVPAVHVDDIHGFALGGHERRHIGAEPAGRDGLPGSDASREESGALPPVQGHGAEQGLEPLHLQLAMDEVLRDVCEIEDGTVADDRRGLLEHGHLRRALRAGRRPVRASSRSSRSSRPCGDPRTRCTRSRRTRYPPGRRGSTGPRRNPIPWVRC